MKTEISCLPREPLSRFGSKRKRAKMIEPIFALFILSDVILRLLCSQLHHLLQSWHHIGRIGVQSFLQEGCFKHLFNR